VKQSIIASHSPLNISETVETDIEIGPRSRLGSKGPPIVNGLWGIQWSLDPEMLKSNS